MKLIFFRTRILFAFIFFNILFYSCTGGTWRPESALKNKRIYRPIYATASEAFDVKISSARPIISAGKIYYKSSYLYVGETGKGVHIIDNRNPLKPVPVSFLSISGNYDVAIKGNVLYANNLQDLVLIDVSNPEQPTVLSRMKNVFKNSDLPPYEGVAFECPDLSKGTIVGWEEIFDATNAKCYR